MQDSAKKPLILAVLAAAALCGCRLTGPSDGVQARQPRDIPVPDGMALQTHQHESHTLEIGRAYRFADLVYEGRTPVAEVASYLTDRMPQHAYRIVSQDTPGAGHTVLVFQRGRYTSECTIRRIDYRTRLEIRLRTNL